MHQRVQKIIFAAVIIVTPSLFITGLPEVFELPKTYFLIFLLLTGSLVQILTKIRQAGVLKIKKLDLIFFGYLLLYGTSTILSVHPFTSFIGYFGRFSGSFLFIFSIISYLIINRDYLKNINKDTLVYLIILSSIFPFAFGAVQVFNVEVFSFSGVERVFSTFGQPNFFAQYLLVIIFGLLYLILEDENHLFIPYYALILLLLLQTQSLSALFVFAAGVFIYLTTRRNLVNKKLLSLITLITFTTLILFGSSLFLRIQEQYGFIHSFNPDSTVITEDTGNIRKIISVAAVKQAAADPEARIIGSGPETFGYTFTRPQELNNTSEWGHLFSKPHNFFAEEFFETGLMGFILLVVLSLYSLYKSKENILGLFVFIILLNSLFLWPISYVYFLLFLFTYNLLASNDKLQMEYKIPEKVMYVNGLSIFGALIISLVYFAALTLLPSSPCLSSKIIPMDSVFTYKCGKQADDSKKLWEAYELNRDNKLVSEGVALGLITSDSSKSVQILSFLLYEEPYNAIYNYELGLVYESRGNIKEAVMYYREANNLVPNFFAANDKVIEHNDLIQDKHTTEGEIQK